MRGQKTRRQVLEARQQFFTGAALIVIAIALAAAAITMLVSAELQRRDLDAKLDEAELALFRLFAWELALTEAPVEDPSRRAFLRLVFFAHNATSYVVTDDYGPWAVEGFYLEPLPCHGIRTLYAEGR
jgi:hypothetical protein